VNPLPEVAKLGARILRRKAGLGYKQDMPCRIRSLPALLALLVLALLLPACTEGPPRGPMDAVRADRWVDAQQAAAKATDPVAGKLVTYFRLMAPNGATAPEIAAFMAENPGWPNRTLLERRRQEALAREADQAIALAQCDRGPLRESAALLRCADAYTAAGRADDAARAVRLAWTSGITDAAAETAFLARWSAVLTPGDQWERFENLAWKNQDAAARQVARLEPARRALAQARLALRRDDPSAPAKLAAVPQSALSDPGLMLDRAAWLRRKDRLDEARDLWLASGEQAQREASPEHRRAYWSERDRLARKLLQTGDDKGAYAVVAAHGDIAGEPLLDAEFLAGFIALRRLHDPATATRHFQALADASGSAITQGRAHYWLGRAAADAGHSPDAEYAKAAAWPVSFYGQLAALALDKSPAALADRIRALRDPTWTKDQALDFAGTELIRAAGLLAAWGDGRRAHAFLLDAEERAPTPAQRSLAAKLALGLEMPDMAVAIARRMGRDGMMLPDSGWPVPVQIPEQEGLDPAIVLALIRQESSFDVQAVSRSGARGLMKLMPATAQEVARKVNATTSLAALTDDPQHNMRLGTNYLRMVLDRFGNSLPLAFAAYNAGPNRVQQWLGAIGDPRGPGIDMLDWIELIPAGETRNYVQRLLENAVIYRARLGNPAPVLLATWSE
jgi:soluble lytic murein transglycosylase